MMCLFRPDTRGSSWSERTGIWKDCSATLTAGSVSQSPSDSMCVWERQRTAESASTVLNVLSVPFPGNSQYYSAFRLRPPGVHDHIMRTQPVVLTEDSSSTGIEQPRHCHVDCITNLLTVMSYSLQFEKQEGMSFTNISNIQIPSGWQSTMV